MKYGKKRRTSDPRVPGLGVHVLYDGEGGVVSPFLFAYTSSDYEFKEGTIDYLLNLYNNVISSWYVPVMDKE